MPFSLSPTNPKLYRQPLASVQCTCQFVVGFLWNNSRTQPKSGKGSTANVDLIRAQVLEDTFKADSAQDSTTVSMGRHHWCIFSDLVRGVRIAAVEKMVYKFSKNSKRNKAHVVFVERDGSLHY